MNKLTPVQSVGGLLFKRDDLYEPFGPGEVNGGKMRQCMMLLDSVKDEISGVISCCSIHSPRPLSRQRPRWPSESDARYYTEAPAARSCWKAPCRAYA